MEEVKRYNNYSAEDFILDERFQNWVMHESEDDFWQGLIRSEPERRESIQAARDFILGLKLKEDWPDEVREKDSLKRFLQRTGKEKAGVQREGVCKEERNSDPVKRGNVSWYRKIAASVLILSFLGGGAWLLLFKKKPVQVETAYGQMKQIVLPDSSVIFLNANSSLHYEKSLLGNFPREVWLKGEAFFQIKKQKNGSGEYRNFKVYTDEMDIEVLGTSFNVKERHSVSSVTLQSGKVQINLDQEKKITLKPGERVEFNRKAKKLVKNKVKPERYTSWKNLRYTFDQTPVSELVQMINDNYGLKVVIKDEEIASSKLSGVLEAENLQTFVNALSFALNITIRKEEDQLIFEPKQR